MMQQTQYQQCQYQQIQPPVTIVTQPPPQLPDKFQVSAVSQMTALCSIQIVMGILCLIFGIVLAVFDYSNVFGEHYVGVQGYGIWAGIYFTIVGGIGIGAVKSNTSGWIISTMVLNIICSVIFCWTLLSYASAGLVQTSINGCSYRFGSSYYNSYYNSYRCDKNMDNIYYAMDSMLLIMSIIQFVITIWCAALCCGAVCRCCKDPVGGHLVQQQVIATYPITQTGVTVQQGYPVGVHQVPVGGYMSQPQGIPMYMNQPQGPPVYSAQAPAGYQPPPVAYPTAGVGMKQ